MSASIFDTIGPPPDPCTRAWYVYKQLCIDFFNPSGSYNTTYYVSDTDGDDSDDGLTPATAYATAAKGFESLAASGGDCQILLNRGDEFREFFEEVISDCDRIKVGSYGAGPRPVLTAFTKEYPAASGWSTSNTSNDWRR